ncbi:MAG: PEPxxWA-CTERM sorting domain-containing protein [Alphaproteobacteria bacterium]|nr:PEPxxWA-CTERM sorting domain-containing protein [Alphaproteobacteria bacterium]MBU1516147.1 PEPxxWA-CTERM sorting domain-containing protein [Alphaproteobacteria bacterium]MBU2092609.1 PEPxxWA-CTERM sorting domain-containing protein [Alphaproteobacteria bacterium]MBU2308465.1 PEPxxWA-CTERM sorting domain-containing protein [Alphaproteobacteria bacterium]MBU2366083.1 PEPxxWA-CTERM sorting domain-containing protein [Alphaproteobacteria bacterium]
MTFNFSKFAAAAAVSLATLAGGVAQAEIVNISATSGATIFNFTAGTFLVEWIGTADGGAYDGWNGSCPTGSCNSGWRENFTVITDPGPNPDLDTFGLPTAYSSALAALAAYKAAPSINLTTLSWNGSGYTPVSFEVINQPFIVYIDAPETIGFFVGDGSPNDNFGGVSLRISAAPEPGTWALMLLGFGAAGATLRARRRVAATA